MAIASPLRHDNSITNGDALDSVSEFLIVEGNKMAFTYRVDQANRLIYTTATEFVPVADLEVHFRHLMEDGVHSYPQLIDARQATFVLSSSEACAFAFTLRTLAKELPVLGPVAVVVTGGVSLAMVRLLGTFTGIACTIKAFLSLDEAKRWLQAQKELAHT